MTPPRLRELYLRWVRQASPALLLPLVLTAAIQAGSTSAWWSAGPAAEGAVRYLFIAVGIAGIAMGRSVRARDTASLALSPPELLSLSWRLVVYIFAPVVIGAVLAFMTRQVWDFYVMLGATLVALVMLFPRFDQWLKWSGSRTDEE